MRCIDADKLLDIVKKERDKAITWRDDCRSLESKNMQMVAEQAILAYNKVICLINGMDVINGDKETPIH